MLLIPLPKILLWKCRPTKAYWPLKQTQAGYRICGIILSEILTSKSINPKSQNIITLPEARMNGKHYKYRVRINVAKQICRKFLEDSRRHL